MHWREIDSRKVRVVELRFFAGLSVDEVAEALKVSKENRYADYASRRYGY